MLSQLKILRSYAKLDDTSIAAKKLPPTVYFSHTSHTLTIFDAYPKALFHFLILPRLQTALSTATALPITLNDADECDGDGDGDGDDGDGDGDKRERRGSDSDSESGGGSSISLVANSETVLTSLRTLLRSAISSSSPSSSSDDAKARARGTLRVLADEATRLRCEIEREMCARYGSAWPIWVGFHAVPSMEHLHLHVISSDLTAEALKTKRHYNSFSPRVGFFLPLADVRAWFEEAGEEEKSSDGDGDQRLVRVMARLAPEKYESCLKDALVCFHCNETAKNMPALKKHLQDEFDALRKREVGKLKRKRETKSDSLDGDKQIGKSTRILSSGGQERAIQNT